MHEKVHSLQKQFDIDRVSARVDIAAPEIDPRIAREAETRGLRPKSEFHLSVITKRTSAILRKRLNGDAVAVAIERLHDLFLEMDWEHRFLQEYNLIRKRYDAVELQCSGYRDVTPHVRTSIVQGVHLPDLERYYDDIVLVTGLIFVTPYAHVTLYSSADHEPFAATGIGVYSMSDLEQYRVQRL